MNTVDTTVNDGEERKEGGCYPVPPVQNTGADPREDEAPAAEAPAPAPEAPAAPVAPEVPPAPEASTESTDLPPGVEEYDGPMGVYKITGEAAYTDEHGVHSGFLPVGSECELPTEVGDDFVAKGGCS